MTGGSSWRLISANIPRRTSPTAFVPHARISCSRSTWGTRTQLFPAARLFQRGNIELLHLHAGGGDAADLRRVRVAQHFKEHLGHHLPGETELVFEPATLRRRA